MGLKAETKNTLIVTIIVVGLLMIALILFLFKGLDIAIYFGIIGIPIIFAVFAYLYIKKVRTLRADPTVKIKTQEIEVAARRLFEIESIVKNIEASFKLNFQDVRNRVNLLKEDFAKKGVIIRSTEKGDEIQDIELAKITRLAISDIENTSKVVKDVISQFSVQLRNSCEIIANTYIKELEDLRNSGFKIDEAITKIKMLSSETRGFEIEKNVEYLNNLNTTFEQGLSKSIEELNKFKQTIEAMGKNTFSPSLDEIQKALSLKNYSQVAGNLKRTLYDMELVVSPDFDTYKKKLLQSFEVIISSIPSDEQREKLEKLKAKAEQTLSPREISQLKEIGDLLLQTSNQIALNIYERIIVSERKIKETFSPSWFYQSGTTFESDLGDLKTINDLYFFSVNFAKLMERMTQVFVESENKARIIISYKKMVESKIKKLLEEKGFVRPDELKIKDAMSFLKLYEYYHQNEVYYDSIDDTLKLRMGIPQYTLIVKVIDKETGNIIQNQNLKIKLLKEEKEILTSETDTKGEVIFKELRKGEYKVTIPSIADYKEISHTLKLDDDARIELKLEKMTLKDKLCKGNEEAISRLIPKFDDKLQREVERKGFVSSKDDIKIKGEYIPCLLYLWSNDKKDLKFIFTGDAHIVYNKKLAMKEIENIIDDIKEDERVNWDVLQKDFLSIPLPLEEIFYIIEELKRQSGIFDGVEFDKKCIWKKKIQGD